MYHINLSLSLSEEGHGIGTTETKCGNYVPDYSYTYSTETLSSADSLSSSNRLESSIKYRKFLSIPAIEATHLRSECHSHCHVGDNL